MVVCICNNIRERDLREAAQHGNAVSACATYRALGCRAKCGQCIRTARAILSEERAAA
jgi:bacterioferritin-associated ferredoxin